MTPFQFVNKAIGVPFTEFGREYNGWDCWGLVLKGYQDVFNISLQDFDYKSVEDYKSLVQNFATRKNILWKSVEPDTFKIACIFRNHKVVHAGLYYENKILHVEKGIETCLERCDRLQIEGYYEPVILPATPI